MTTMKAGRDTGSLVNHLISRSRNPAQPEVGGPATLLSWTDRNPGTVISITKVGKAEIIAVQEDHYRRIDDNGLSEVQKYEYSPNINGHVSYFRASKTRGWEQVIRNHETGRWKKISNGGVTFARREKYHDFSF
jgi:hypothetical protein